MPSRHALQAVPFQPPPAVDNLPSVQLLRRRQSNVFVRAVRAANLSVELATIRSLLPGFPFVTVHAEYPRCDGGLLPPGVREQDLSPAVRYALAKIDVDAHPLLQLGITLCDAGGRLPMLPGPTGPAATVWQVGFRTSSDARQGVSIQEFRAALFASGVVANENKDKVTWVAFGGLYNFGFLLKIFTDGMPLPETNEEFSVMLAGYLGCRRVFDARYIAAKLPMGVNMDVDLMAVAKLLAAPAVAAGREMRQAGEKSLAASQVFMRMTGLFFAWQGVGMHAGRIHGLN